MRVKRSQTRAADNAIASDHEAGPLTTASSSSPKPLKRPHSVQRDRLTPTIAASPAKTADTLAKKVVTKAHQLTLETPNKQAASGETAKATEAMDAKLPVDSKKRARNNVEPTTVDTTKTPKNGESSAQKPIESQTTTMPDKKREPSPVKQKPTAAKKPNLKPNTSKKEPPKKDKKTIANKELKNLDIQLSGYNSVLSTDSMEATSDTNIKASISEIVKTKSRASATQSIYSKAAAQIDKEKITKPTEIPPDVSQSSVEQKTVNPKTGKEAAKKATTPKATQVSKMSITKRTARPIGKMAKLQAGLLESASDALKGNADAKLTEQTSDITKTNIETEKEVKKSEGSKAKTVFRSRAKNAKPRAVTNPIADTSPLPTTSSEEENKTSKGSKPTSTKAKASKPSTVTKRTKTTKPKPIAPRRKPKLPKTSNIPSETISIPPPSIWTLQASDSLPFANSPNFSDPDTVTSPMVPADASETEAPISGNSHIRKMVADILQNLEMSDDVSGNEQSFPKAITTNPPCTEKTIKPEQDKPQIITVKSIESMTDGGKESKNAIEIKMGIKKEEYTDDQIADDASKIEEGTEASTTGTIECSTDATAGTSLEATPTKKPPSAKRKKPITQKQAKALKAKATSNPSKNQQHQEDNTSKDIYDFHESGHSSEDTSASYIKSVSKKGDDPEDTTKPISKPGTPKKVHSKSIPKKSAKHTEDEPDEEDDDSSDSSDNKALATKVTAKQLSSPKASDASSNSGDDSESGSDTSVRTRVNKRRKSAVKSRRLRLFGFYSGPKRHRMASLNALAKVQCLYENESRTAQELGFVREPRVAPRVRLAGCPDNTTSRSAAAVAASAKKLAVAEEKEANKLKKESEATEAAAVEVEKKMIKTEGSKAEETEDKLTKHVETSTSDESEEEEMKIDIDAPRSLRTVPGLRGAGKLWEMGNMSSFQSDSEPDNDDTYEQVNSSFFHSCTK